MTYYTPDAAILTTDLLRIDTQAFAAYVNRLGGDRAAETREYIEAVTSGALRLGIDPVVMLAQWALETNYGRSQWWTGGLNPAGIGITGDAAQNARAQTWKTGTAAAYGHLAHMAAYLWGEDAPDAWPMSWPELSTADKRFGLVVQSGYQADSLRDLNRTWAVDPQDNYHGKLADRANRIVRDYGQGGYMPTITFGKVPKPPMKLAIVEKPAHTGSMYGYDYVPGGRKILGVVHHETMGRGSGPWYQRFFSCPNGERCRNALVDFLIDKAGVIWQLNDPFGVRAGWANGGGVGSPGGLEGDGPAFYAKFGASGINNRLISIEYEKLSHENFTDAQVQAGGALAAWIHDKDGQRWDEHPYTSKYGLVTSFLHFEFGTTNCGKGELDDITRVQAATKGIMRKWQEGGSDDPVDPDVPPLPEPEIPGGLTLEEAQRRFGTATRYKDGKVTTGLGFDPDGPISLAWAHRAAVEKTWPQIEAWYVVEDSGQALHVVTFANDWRLVLVHERQGWQWMDYKVIQEAV